MISAEKKSIAESISRIERFPTRYPKRIEVKDPKWQEFFDWQYDLCCQRAMELGVDIASTQRILDIE